MFSLSLFLTSHLTNIFFYRWKCSINSFEYLSNRFFQYTLFNSSNFWSLKLVVHYQNYSWWQKFCFSQISTSRLFPFYGTIRNSMHGHPVYQKVQTSTKLINLLYAFECKIQPLLRNVKLIPRVKCGTRLCLEYDHFLLLIICLLACTS